MPIHKSGYCDFCGKYSDLLFSVVGIHKASGKLVAGWQCTECEKYFKEKQEKQWAKDGENDA